MQPIDPTAPVPAAPPDGYWINPSNPNQWLPPADAAKLGGVCFFGTGVAPGRLRVTGSREATRVYCGCFFNSTATDSLVFYGGMAALALWLMPSPYRWYVGGPLAALALLGVTLGYPE